MIRRSLLVASSGEQWLRDISTLVSRWEQKALPTSLRMTALMGMAHDDSFEGMSSEPVGVKHEISGIVVYRRLHRCIGFYRDWLCATLGLGSWFDLGQQAAEDDVEHWDKDEVEDG